MNLLRLGALLAGSKWRRTIVSVAFFLGSSHAFGASHRASSIERRGPAQQTDILPAQQAATHATPKDLPLGSADERKADALASFMQGLADEENADTDQALTDYQKVLALDPGYTQLAIKVSDALARRGDASQGIEVLK